MASPAPRPQFLLQSGTSVDLDEVMQVMDQAFSNEFGEAWTRSQLSGILPMTGVSLTVARSGEEGRAAGFSLARTVADEAELLLIAVDPRFHRRGVARQLLDHFLAGARGGQVRRVHLEVRDGNPAVAMYRELGFEPVGRRRDYYLGGDQRRHDAITLARSP
ncbi:MAG: GNAT family N-acetyltransferase [Sphingomicrobium sp.]